jgi:hypothetical protein
MGKIVAVLLLAALAVLAVGIIAKAASVQPQTSFTPPLMYAGIRG